MSNFYTLLTRVGAALHANAQVNQTTVPWTHFRLGDGNGAAVVPNENQTGLVRQVHRLQITDISVHPDNPNWVIAEAVVPSDVGGWTVREAAIYGGADGNTCIAVGNYPETYKPVLSEGAGREMVMRMVVEISSVATVKLQIDPAVAIASRAWVESLVATPAKAGLVKLASLQEHIEGETSGKAATPAGVKEAIAIATEQVMDEVLLDRARVDVTAQFEVTLNATLTGSDNNIAAENLAARLGLEKGDVIQVVAGAHTKLHTVESLTDANNLAVNYEHCGSRGNGSLKLPDYTGVVTIKRVAKWFNAPIGLGQAWVSVTGGRVATTDYPNSTGRTIVANIHTSLGSGGYGITLHVDGLAVAYADTANAGDSTVSAEVPSGSVLRLTLYNVAISNVNWWEFR